MTANRRFQCPACGFAVFNRRVPTCESCSSLLPASFLFSARELAAIDAEHERNESIRKDLASEAEEAERRRAKRRGDGG
jgi:hypothetical protein